MEPQVYGTLAELLASGGPLAAFKTKAIIILVVVCLATVIVPGAVFATRRAWRPRPEDDDEGLGAAPPWTPSHGYVAVGLMLLAAVVRLVNLGAESISSQEVSYLYNAIPPRSPGLLTVLFDISDLNPHAPGFRWAMAWWSRASIDLGWLRAGPAVVAAALAPILYLWMRRHGLEREGVVSGVLAALSPLIVFVSRTTMPFGSVITALALTAWAQDELLRRKGARWTLALALAASGSAWLSYSGGTFLIVLIVSGALRVRHSPALRRRFVRAWAFAILLGLPLAWQLLSFFGIRSKFTLEMFGAVMARRTPGEALAVFLGVGCERLAGGMGDPGVRSIVFALLCCVGALILARRPIERRPTILPLAIGFLLFAVVETVGFGATNGFTYVALRRFVLVAPFAFPLAAIGLVALAEGTGQRLGSARSEWSARAPLVASLIVATAVGVPHAGTIVRGGLRPDIQQAVDVVAAGVREGDALLFGPASFFESVFWWHAQERQMPQPPHRDGPHWTPLKMPNRGPIRIFLSQNDEYVSAPISAAPLDVQRVWIVQLLEQPLGLRELDFANVEGYRDSLSRLGFRLVEQSLGHKAEVDLWQREPPSPPDRFVIEAGRTDYPYVRGTCPAIWMPTEERALLSGSTLMLPPLRGVWTLDLHGRCTEGCPADLSLNLPPGVTATRQATGTGFALSIDTSTIALDTQVVEIGVADPDTESWDLDRYMIEGCPEAATTYRHIDVRFAPAGSAPGGM